MSILHKDVTIKKMPPNADLGSRLIPMSASDLKNGMWTLDDKTGVPGIVSDLKMSKTGKHGHAKFTYKIRMPHSGRSASLMHPGGDHLLRPQMDKIDYLVSHIDGEEDLVCLDENYEEIFFKLSPTREDVYQKVLDTIQKAQEESKDAMVTVLEGPMKMGEKIDIIQIVTEAKMVAANKEI